MAAFQLRYSKDLGFLNEEILKEIKKQVETLKNQFEPEEIQRFSKLSELAEKSSGRGFF